MKTDITYLGKVIRVDSNCIEVEVSKEIPSAAPIINGRLYKIGQIGTFVKMPIGNITIFGIVSSVSNTPSNIEQVPLTYDPGSRFLTVQLIGEKIGQQKFEKGIGTYPTINDEVHLVVEMDLKDIYGEKEVGSIEIGKHSSSENLAVNIDLHNLILRHCSIIGSTGSGKSNTTVGLIKTVLNSYKGSRIILIDPHGEYSSAFPDNSIVYKINDKINPLFIPFWLMNFDELSYFLVGAKPADDAQPQYRKLRELITEYKKESVNDLKAGIVDSQFVTADSPIPFDIRKLWHEINWWLNASFSETQKDLQTMETALETDPGDPKNLKPAQFQPYAMGSTAPYKSRYSEYYSYEKKLLLKIRDSRFNFMFNPGDYVDANSPKDLDSLLREWIDNDKRLTILDLSGVPFELLDISVGLITRFVFDSMFWGATENYTGKNRPILIAFEEAHSYLPKGENIKGIHGYSKAAVEKIFKEGRKFGLGALVISQRPSEISETILAQVGTFIALRLTNSSDKFIIKSSSPDNMNSLIDLLPALRVGEAIIVGEAIKIPSRVRIPLNHPRPTSADPQLIKAWQKKFSADESDYKKVIKYMREQKKK